jgi:hypothetical protein
VIIAQNRLGASPKKGISLEGIIIFLEKISAKTPNPELLRSIPVEIVATLVFIYYIFFSTAVSVD